MSLVEKLILPRIFLLFFFLWKSIDIIYWKRERGGGERDCKLYFKCQFDVVQSYLHSESEGLYISIIKRSRNTYIFIARSIKFPSFAFNLKFLAFLLPPRFSLRPSKILCIKKRRNCVRMEERSILGEGWNSRGNVRERNRFLLFSFDIIDEEFLFRKRRDHRVLLGSAPREKSRCCKIEWALLNIITVGDFHGWTSRNMLRNIHCSGIDLAQWRQEAGRRWPHPFSRKPFRIVTIFSSVINLRGRSS